MGSQIIIRVDNKTKEKFYRLVRMEGRTASDKVREMVENYIKKSSVEGIVDDLWRRIGTKMKGKGFREKDVQKIVRKVRASK